MSTVSDISTGLKGIIVAELGAEYKELLFGIDVSKNKFNGGKKGYAVTLGAAEQLDGALRNVTLHQEFHITLTETYASSQTTDQSQQVAAETLRGRLDLVYLRAVREKAGATGVLTVSDLKISPPQFLDSNTAVLTSTVYVQYRNAL